ncbi:MAG: fatty acid desaturase [Gemmatimonadota bacterium]
MTNAPGAVPAAGASWAARLAPYRSPQLPRSLRQLAVGLALFAAAWTLMYASLAVGYWLTLLLAVPTAFLLIRLFIIQHDCGHGSFFRSARWAGVVGSVLGVLTLTPYHYWKKTHALHHATSGNLDHRGFGDVDTWTVDEYKAASRWQRFRYRVYRHPAFLFGIGAALHFFVRHRLPMIVPREWVRERRSILWTNVGIAAVIVLLGAWLGFETLLLVHLPVALIASSIGVWLFYVQHQFEPTYWEHDERWEYDAAALQGSSFYRLPKLLQWATGNIGLHHIHHLHARIPNYRLQQVLDDHPELHRVPTLTLRDSFRCVRLALWDERAKKLVPFRAASPR